MASNKVVICGVDTSKLPRMTAAQTSEMLYRVKQGEPGLRETFIYHNLRLVLSVIQRYTNRCDSVDDLFQVGCIGLMKAIDNFDITLGVRFSTYAVPMIIGEIRRYLRDNNPIRVSRSIRDTAYKALQTRDRLSVDGREPTVQEIAHEMGIESEAVVFALEAIQDPISLFEPIYNDGGDTIFVLDQVKDDKVLDDAWLEAVALKEAMGRLSGREKRILRMRFFEGRTQMEAAGEKV